MMTLFPGFTEERVAVNGIHLFVRSGGTQGKPPLVLLHGYPQTSAMWHGVVAELKMDYHIICPDLRGYGRSDKPASDANHSTYSKRTMGADIAALIKHFGYDRVFLGAHDRGARVAHRLGLDHPHLISAMVLLDIAPTREMYANTSTEFARRYWHWFFLIQKFPLPETLIGADPRAYWMMKCTEQSRNKDPFHPDALEEYLFHFETTEAVHASCEDYRAAASIDIVHDDADNNKKLPMPLHVLWAKHGVIESCFDALSLWRTRATTVTGQAIDTTHYMAEEIPFEIAHQMHRFFDESQSTID